MENNIKFKKALLGGFKREAVMDYISSQKDEFFRYKKDTVEKAEEAKKKITELEQAYNLLLEENEALKTELSKMNDSEAEAEEEKKSVKALIESLTESMNVLIGVLSTDEKNESDEPDTSDEQETRETPSDDEKITGEEPEEIEKAQENSDKSIDDIINKYLDDEN